MTPIFFPNHTGNLSILKHKSMPMVMTGEFDFYRCIPFSDKLYGKTVSELHAGNLRLSRSDNRYSNLFPGQRLSYWADSPETARAEAKRWGANNTMYLYTHGIAPSVKAASRKYFQGGKSVPLPLKVIRYYGSSNMAQIANEILGLSRMNWNSFNLYSKLPCTIESSNQIAQIGWLLSQFEGSLYDYRFFM